MVVGLHLLCRSYFLPLANKRRDTIPPEEGEDLQDAVARRPGKPPPPLHKPLKIYLTFSDLRRPPHRHPHLHLPRAYEFPTLPPKPPRALPKAEKGKKFFEQSNFESRCMHNMQSLLLGENPLRGPHLSKTNKQKKS